MIIKHRKRQVVASHIAIQWLQMFWRNEDVHSITTVVPEIQLVTHIHTAASQAVA